jgi:hypothetical protein
MTHLIVLIEGILACTATVMLWRNRRSQRLGMWSVLFGMGWCALIHGFSFGVLRPGDPDLIAGFGLSFAIFFGIPLGAILGLVLQFLRARVKP